MKNLKVCVCELQFLVKCDYSSLHCSNTVVLIGRQEGHQVCKNAGLFVVTI